MAGKELTFLVVRNDDRVKVTYYQRGHRLTDTKNRQIRVTEGPVPTLIDSAYRCLVEGEWTALERTVNRAEFGRALFAVLFPDDQDDLTSDIVKAAFGFDGCRAGCPLE